MTKTYLKVFLRKETQVLACLKLMEDLKASHLVEDAQICSGIFSESTKTYEARIKANSRGIVTKIL